MRNILLAIGLLLLACTGLQAQGCGPSNPNCVVPLAPNGDNSNRAASTAWVTANGGTGSITLPSADLLVGNASNIATARALSGDCALTNLGAITCTKTNGTAFGALATATPGTGVAAAIGNALNGASGLVGFSGALGTPTSGTGTNLTGIPVAGIIGPTGGGTQCLHSSNAGAVTGTGSDCGSGGGAVSSVGNASADTSITIAGTGAGPWTGAVTAKLNLANAQTWSGQQTFVAPILGTPASGVGTNLTGTAAGLTAGNVTTNANLTGDVTSTGNATTYNNVVPVAKGGAGAITGALKGNGSGTVSQAACADLSNGATGCSTAIGTSGATIGLLNAANAWSAVQTFAASDLVLTGGSGCATFTAGVLSSTGSACGGSGSVGGNPTATAGPTAINGTASTYMRSDGAPAVQKASNAQFGIVEGDNTTITCASGVCGQKATILTNSLGSNVPIPVTNTYVDGPSVAQGTTGTWDAIGSVNLVDTSSAAAFFCKLWDGTTLIASGGTQTAAANFHVQITLGGALATPAANIRISCTNNTTTNGLIASNSTGLGKDSTITVRQVQ